MAESTTIGTTRLSTSSSAPIATFKKRNTKNNIRKRPATPPPASEDSDASDYASEDDTATDRTIKRRRKGGIDASVAISKHAPTTNLTADTHSASTSTALAASDDATKISYLEQLGREQHRDTKHGPSIPGSNAPSKQMGPVKAASNIRTITMIDLAPDVCKDYKQTGFCGFGDNCKFLHAREDYKQGWELDRDWEINTKGKKLNGKIMASANRGGNKDEEKTEDERLKDIPFACFICKGPYKDPIITKCGHYFCEKCALTRYKKTPSCAACEAGTGGVFKVAKDLQKLLDRKRKAQEEEEGNGDDEEA